MTNERFDFESALNALKKPFNRFLRQNFIWYRFDGDEEATAKVWISEYRGYPPMIKRLRHIYRVANAIVNRQEIKVYNVELQQDITDFLAQLFTPPFDAYGFVVPAAFWNSELGQAIQICQNWLHQDLRKVEIAAVINGIEYVTPVTAAALTDLTVRAWRFRLERNQVQGAIRDGKKWLIPLNVVREQMATSQQPMHEDDANLDDVLEA